MLPGNIATEIIDTRKGIFEYDVGNEDIVNLLNSPSMFENINEMPDGTEKVSFSLPFLDHDPEDVIVEQMPLWAFVPDNFDVLNIENKKLPTSLTSWYEISLEDSRILQATIAESRKDKALISLPRGVPKMLKRMLIGQSDEQLFIEDRSVIFSGADNDAFSDIANFHNFCNRCKDQTVLDGARAIMKMISSLNETGTLSRTTFSVYVAQSWLKGKQAPLPKFSELREYAIEKVSGFLKSKAASEMLVNAFHSTIRLIQSISPVYFDLRQAEYVAQLEAISLSDQQIVQGLLRKETVLERMPEVKGKTQPPVRKIVHNFPKIRTDVKVSERGASIIKSLNDRLRNDVNQSLQHVKPLDRIETVKSRLELAYKKADHVNSVLSGRKREILADAKVLQSDPKNNGLALSLLFVQAGKAYTVNDDFLFKGEASDEF